jgi:hypothetical protein
LRREAKELLTAKHAKKSRSSTQRKAAQARKEKPLKHAKKITELLFASLAAGLCDLGG